MYSVAPLSISLDPRIENLPIPVTPVVFLSQEKNLRQTAEGTENIMYEYRVPTNRNSIPQLHI
jgi:hypothetical protein